MTLYPDGYGIATISLERMREKHGVKMHPEFARRFFAYIEHKNGLLGVGGGWRSTQPSKPGFAPDGKSFHQSQQFASGRVAYAAVDLVVPVFGGAHRSPTWGECADAPRFGLHTFIKSPPEPWHIQCIEMRGWQTWVNAGRPDPQFFQLPEAQLPPPFPPPTPQMDEVEMIALDYKPGTPQWVALSWTGTHLSHVFNGHADAVIRGANVPRQTVNDAQLDGIIASSMTTTMPPPEFSAERKAEWLKQRG